MLMDVGIGMDLPYAQHTQSVLVCRISGQLMDENNLPMALPNGQVYSFNSLETMISESDDKKITCPITKDKFSFSDLTKVFVL